MPPKGWKAGKKPARARKEKSMINDRVAELRAAAKPQEPKIKALVDDLELRKEALHYAINMNIHTTGELLEQAERVLYYLKGGYLPPEIIGSVDMLEVKHAAPAGSSHAMFTPAPYEPPRDEMPAAVPTDEYIPRPSPFSETHAL